MKEDKIIIKNRESFALDDILDKVEARRDKKKKKEKKDERGKQS